MEYPFNGECPLSIIHISAEDMVETAQSDIAVPRGGVYDLCATRRQQRND